MAARPPRLVACRPQRRRHGAAVLVCLLAAGQGWAQPDPADALLAAARAGDHVAALDYLAQTSTVDARDPTGTSVLHWAVYHDDLALVTALIERGADVSRGNDYGSTPLAEAAINGDPAMLERLLAAGADPDSANAEGQTALMVLARTENVAAAELLLKSGADPDAREQWKAQTALMWAAARGRDRMVALLLAYGADPDARSRVHDWPRQMTVFPRAKYLPSGGLTPLLYAARSGCVACAEALVLGGADVDLADPDEIAPLLMAVLNANFDTARYLLEVGADPDKWDWWGRTPLYAAVDFNTLPTGGRPDLPAVDTTSAVRLIELLLNAGANPDSQIKLSMPYRNVVDDRGADLALSIGATPLLRAAIGADLAATELLLAHGARVDLANQDGMTPLMAATGLRSYSIDTRGRFRTEAEALAVSVALLDAGAAINRQDDFGQAALHGAAFRGWNRLVTELVSRGADPALADNDGHTPLDAAEGRLRGVGREAALVTVRPETAALLRDLLPTQ